MLVVEDLSFSYRLKPVFSKVNFELKAGCVGRVSGQNGCGKSTLLSVCAGLRAAQNGRVSWVDKNQKKRLPKEKMQYLPAEANGLFQKFTAMENLEFWLSFYGSPAEADAVEALKHWGFRQKLVRTELPVAHFSTGMKRRLAFAKLTLSKSPLWILDEPLYGLDEQGIEQFNKMVLAHLQAGGAVLLVSHDVQSLSGLPMETFDLKRWKHA